MNVYVYVCVVCAGRFFGSCDGYLGEIIWKYKNLFGLKFQFMVGQLKVEGCGRTDLLIHGGQKGEGREKKRKKRKRTELPSRTAPADQQGPMS